MNKEEGPYIRHCSFCEQGMLRFMRCQECESVSAICDECELTWSDIAAVSAADSAKSAGAFPACPACDTPGARWKQLDESGVRDAELGVYIGGSSG